jgi:hypothetical protein
VEAPTAGPRGKTGTRARRQQQKRAVSADFDASVVAEECIHDLKIDDLAVGIRKIAAQADLDLERR